MSLNHKITSWKGQRVWIIGASTGIGAETTRALLASGARLALSARSFDKLQAVAFGHADALILPLDITDHAAVLAAQSEIWPAGRASIWS